MRRSTNALAPLLGLALAIAHGPLAWAQVEGVPQGAGETPEAPPEFDAKPPDDPAAARPVRTGYPLELALRPLTLDAGMAEVTSDTALYPSPVRATERLRVRYGITDRVEFGLRYTIGTVAEEGFTAGKTVAVDTQVRILDWLSVQLALPVLLDPFAMGVVLGAPMKIDILDKAAVFFGRDLVSVRLDGFVPVIEDPLSTEALVQQRDTNTILPRGDIRLLGGLIYQIEPDLALTAELGVVARDFGLSNAGVPMSITLTFARSAQVDLGARLGFDDLSQDADSFNLAGLAAFRL